MSKGSGYGKTILFGEHFVVYGLPAIASALGSQTTATVRVSEGEKWIVDDQRPATPGYKKKKYNEAEKAISNVIEYCNVDTKTKKLEIIFSGDLYAASGVGASAAQVASLARALNEEFNLDFDDEKINEAAYEGEKAYHGTPSGIDNTAATYGGLIWFEKNLTGGPNTIDRLKSGKKIELVIGNTGMTASTTEVVADVRQLKEDQPEKLSLIFQNYKEIANKAKKALIEGDISTIGNLMNQNHTLLQEITVSCKELDELVELTRSKGALGAKMTGTGRGGLVIAVAPNKETQEEIAKAIEEIGLMAWRSTIG
ncbi:MAG: mevalonate kinase [Candidatus Hodarchaeales archaeon]